MPDWICARSGCCCVNAGGVVMTPGEHKAIEAVDPRPVMRRVLPDGRLAIWRLEGGNTCPYYADRCLVYDVRPGVCRAFGCFRRPGEEFRGADGMMARFHESAGVRRVALKMAREAEQWTDAHS